MCADHVYVQLQPVRVQRSVQADVSTPTHWQKSLMRDISDGNSRINSNLVLQDARITAGIKGGMNIEYKEDDCISCGVCVKACRQDALKMVDGKIELDAQKCNHCGRCVKSCPVDAWKGTPGYIVSFGGTFGNNIYKGEELLPLILDKETLFRVTDAAINFFEKNANPSERFRKTLQRVGEEDFRSQLKDAYEGQ